MPIRYEFTVFSYGMPVAQFTSSEHAQAFAQMLSDYELIVSEVHFRSADRRRKYGDGVVGQYENGKPTPEFAAREDSVHPDRTPKWDGKRPAQRYYRAPN